MPAYQIDGVWVPEYCIEEWWSHEEKVESGKIVYEDDALSTLIEEEIEISELMKMDEIELELSAPQEEPLTDITNDETLVAELIENNIGQTAFDSHDEGLSHPVGSNIISSAV